MAPDDKACVEHRAGTPGPAQGERLPIAAEKEERLMFHIVKESVAFGSKEITLETGRFALQASGACLVTCGDTQVLVAVIAAASPKPGMGFFPLSVDYLEKFYAAGRIPGGYFKREAKPTDREVLTSRLIDRAIRPLFPDAFQCETQVVATVVSVDPLTAPAVLALLGASAALHLSDIPFGGPVAAVRVGWEGTGPVLLVGENQGNQDLELIVAGTKDGILMVEAAANFLTEEHMLTALAFAEQALAPLCKIQDVLRKKSGKEKRPVAQQEDTLAKRIGKDFAKQLGHIYGLSGKEERKTALASLRAEAGATLSVDGAEPQGFGDAFEQACSKVLRSNILVRNTRVDGRSTTDIRPLDCQVGILARPHGSALFTRGETQSLGAVTLGTPDDAQRLETVIKPADEKHFLFHYNMPGYSVGEPKRLGASSRREIGHGNLAEKALRIALPPRLKFPYTVRVVSEILSSNGSSSMASVCSASLALLDAGVPLQEPVAGIAMGLIKEGSKVAVLSDILGDEDALGDMDFKVAGGKAGITALQMDMKISGVSLDILATALTQAKTGRLHILDAMAKALPKSRDLSARAPRIEQIKIRPERVRDLIGPGGKNIKRIVLETGCRVDVDEGGVVSLASSNGESAAKARKMIHYLTSDPEVGEIFLGTVKKVSDFGAFVEIKPGIEGLVHISQLAAARVTRVEEVVGEGEDVLVKVIEVDRTGRIKLSRKDAIGLAPTNPREMAPT